MRLSISLPSKSKKLEFKKIGDLKVPIVKGLVIKKEDKEFHYRSGLPFLLKIIHFFDRNTEYTVSYGNKSIEFSNNGRLIICGSKAHCCIFIHEDKEITKDHFETIKVLFQKVGKPQKCFYIPGGSF